MHNAEIYIFSYFTRQYYDQQTNEEEVGQTRIIMDIIRNEYIILPPATGGKKLRGRYASKIKVIFILEQDTKSLRGSSGIALPIL